MSLRADILQNEGSRESHGAGSHVALGMLHLVTVAAIEHFPPALLKCSLTCATSIFVVSPLHGLQNFIINVVFLLRLIARIDAILRLKGLEEHWRKNKSLQTGFLMGMEEYLGVVERRKWNNSSMTSSAQAHMELGEDAWQADAQVQMDVESKNRARERYQRLFWEPVVEGQDPIMGSNLERARIEAREKVRAEEEYKAAHAGIPPKKHDEHGLHIPGRPSWKFVDVGGKFVDVNDRVRRLKESERRSKLKVRRRQRKEAVAPGDQQVQSLAATA
ncbi:hypothetical protein POSPLADRAFT_1175681 [Postia placenta MAD-698-R-SB12]|uniref:Uncharacterized protein n=1 Tax=Postia placenta MAD-698-R-SB12 TaxID=670580 RepID=A0A1X6NEL3_9APHY|nr:hypothetical protein POSPLADRAFT_1175681 [Postia placenta MAD-698-R-SB12]OSX66960.1 hypothetical protein POSPLADRAFT_1175681 [Postia placenta MAD-698-R-SB12]